VSNSLPVEYYDCVANELPRSGRLHLSVLRLISFLPIKHEILWGARWAFCSTDVPDPQTEITYPGSAVICQPENFLELQKLVMGLQAITGFGVVIIKGSEGKWHISYSPIEQRWSYKFTENGSCQRG
jgi:hypothetical protein